MIKNLTDIDLTDFYADYLKLKKQFYLHNHNDIIPFTKGDKVNVISARMLQVGNTSFNTPAIQLASIASDPDALSNGDFWFDGSNLHIRIGGTTYHLEHNASDKIRFNSTGGLMVKLTNKSGITSVKGYCVTNDNVTNNAVRLVPVNVPNCVGVFYESGVADGSEAWIVVSGIADVYFWGSTTVGQLARTGLTADTGEVAGQAMSEAVPTSPFATDKHFCEIGHVLETRTGAGLAKVLLHFN